MNLKDFLSIVDQFKYIQGIEGKLRRRRRNGLLATVATILIGLFAVIREVFLKNEFILEYLAKVVQYTLFAIQYFLSHFWSIITLQWDVLPAYRIVYDVVGVYIILLGLVIYLLNRHTAFLFSMSEEPFQYTFWIDRFQRAEDRDENSDAISADDPIHHLLHHDLMDMLNRKIGRFSLLDEKYFKADADPDKTPPTHIHIDGHYAIRDEEKNDQPIKVIQIIPRVRIGPPGNPSILTRPVKIELDNENLAPQPKTDAESNTENAEKAKNKVDISWLDPEIYDQVREQVYSRVASEIYKQIKSDIKQKIHLFPTSYLRAVALYYEAEDFSRSNTIDSYDYAIELYQEALRNYDISIRSVLSNWLLYLKPLRLGVRYESMYASTKIGYAKCLIYRRQISSLTGRTKNPLYAVPGELNQVVNRLIKLHNKFHIRQWRIEPIAEGDKDESEQRGIKNRLNLILSALLFQKDTWYNKTILRKLDIARFEKLKKLLFEAYVVLALVYTNLEAEKKAEANLENAKATYPEKCDSNALFLLAKAEAEFDIELKIPLLIQSTEIALDFEIAQYLLAKYMLHQFLSGGQVEGERAKPVIKQFKKVLEINPGNIASFAHLGYLYWLTDDKRAAQKQFEQGINSKAIVQQTFIGELNYGLARIAAEQGRFNDCYDLYRESLAAEPGLGAYSLESVAGKARVTPFYDDITPSLLDRYRSYKQNFENRIQAVDGQKSISITTLNQSYSYVLNDYGNACLNYYHRFGDIEQLDAAIDTFKQAIKLHPNNSIVYYNISNAVMWRSKGTYEDFQQRKKYLEKADETMLTPWPKVIIQRVTLQALELPTLKKQVEEDEKSLKNLKDEIVKDESQNGIIQDNIKRIKDEIVKNKSRDGEIQDKINRRKQVLQETVRPLDDKGQPLEQLEKDLEELEKKLETKKSTCVEKEGRLKGLRSKLENLEREFINSLTSAIRRTVKLSNFTAMIEGFGIDRVGSSIDRLFDINITPDRLDERDIEALTGWADLLSINQADQQTIARTVNLCKFVSRYKPESLDIDMILFNDYQRAEDLEIERILRETQVNRLIDQDELEELLGEHRAKELTKQPPGVILEDRYTLDQIKARLKSPFCKPGDIRHPQSLLTKLSKLLASLALDAEIKALKELQRPWYKRKIRRDDLALELVRTLNRLMKSQVYKEGSGLVEQLSPRTLELIRFELAGKLKGDDLIRLNRRLLEELFPADIDRSPVEFYQERICETIQNVWLARDPVHFLALDAWAKRFLVFPEYEKALKKAIQSNTLNGHVFHRMLAELYEKYSYADHAMRNFEQALEDYSQQAIYHLKLSQVLRRNHQFDAARERIQGAQAKNIITADEYNQELKEILADEAWAEKEYRKQRIAHHYGQKWVDQLLVVTPIVVEVASDLIPLVADEGGELRESIQALVEQMRDRILREFGVRVPGIRFRGNESDFPPGTYLLMINEIPLVSGRMAPDQKLFTGTRAEIEELGIRADGAVDPLTGRSAYWIQESDVAKLNTPTMPVLDAAAYLIRHLEVVLHQHLVEFLGHQEVQNLVEEKCPDKVAQYGSHSDDLTRLTAVLRGLINERVPITNFPEILAYVEQHQAEPNVTDLINGVRLLPQVRQELPGNRNITHYLQLSAQIKVALQQAIHAENGQYVLAMLPETCQEVLSAVRDKIKDQDNVAIIVTDQRLRCLASQLLKLEFPNTPVIAQHELLQSDADGAQDIAEIDFA